MFLGLLVALTPSTSNRAVLLDAVDLARAANARLTLLTVVKEPTEWAVAAEVDLVYERGYPVTVNHPEQTEIAKRIASEVAGQANVHQVPPMMGAEDFAYMLEARPGAFIFVGNGDSAGLHHPAYNFNDDAIVFGTSYWIKLVENTMAA